MSKITEVSIAGHRLRLTNLDKMLYPEASFTKAQVVDYYVRISGAMLPHLADRPISLKRYPEGVNGFFFFEKRCPVHRPAWVATSTIAVKTGSIDFCVVEDAASLAWLGNLACLEIHTYLYRRQAPHVPTMMVFDLDPGAPAGLHDCCEIALVLRDLLQRHGLQSFIKTSGSKGLHLSVPLNQPNVTFEQTKAFAKAAAQAVATRIPERATPIMAKSERSGKIFIDWSQNDFAKTTCCVYSLRARSRPTVSSPLEWRQVERATPATADRLLLEAPAVLADVAAHGDRFAPVVTLRQSLPTAPITAADLVSAAPQRRHPAPDAPVRPRRGRRAPGTRVPR